MDEVSKSPVACDQNTIRENCNEEVRIENDTENCGRVNALSSPEYLPYYEVSHDSTHDAALEVPSCLQEYSDDVFAWMANRSTPTIKAECALGRAIMRRLHPPCCKKKKSTSTTSLHNIQVYTPINVNECSKEPRIALVDPEPSSLDPCSILGSEKSDSYQILLKVPKRPMDGFKALPPKEIEVILPREQCGTDKKPSPIAIDGKPIEIDRKACPITVNHAAMTDNSVFNSPRVASTICSAYLFPVSIDRGSSATFFPRTIESAISAARLPPPICKTTSAFEIPVDTPSKEKPKASIAAKLKRSPFGHIVNRMKSKVSPSEEEKRADVEEAYKESYDKAYDDAYDDAYDEAYEDAYTSVFDMAYEEAYKKAYDNAYDSAYHEAFADARRDTYNDAYNEGYKNSYKTACTEASLKASNDAAAKARKDAEINKSSKR